MAITDSINALFKRLSGKTSSDIVAGTPQTSASETPLPPRNLAASLGALMVQKDRTSIVKSCRDLYKTDPRVRRILKTVSADVVKGGYTVKCKNNPEAEAIANDQEKRLKLTSKLDDWSRMAFVDGDLFLELGVDKAGKIAAISRKPTLEMRRNSNQFDTFDTPENAFYWVGDSPMSSMREIPDDAVPFARWQIVHARWDHDEGQRYGSPMFASAVQTAKYVTDGEKNMAIRRLVRAGIRYHHKVDGSEAEINEYRRKNQDALNDPFAPITDLFGNSVITSLAQDANLTQYDDVMHHVRTLGLASPIALGLIGYGQDLNRDVLDEQQQQYERTLESMTEWLQAQVVEPLVQLEWLLAGIYPDSVEYEFVWKSKQPFTAKNLKAAAEAGVALQALGYDPDVINSVLSRFMPGLDSLVGMGGMPPQSNEANPAAIAGAMGR
jgi:hypothetical protein